MLALTIAVEGENVAGTLASMREYAPELTYVRWPAITPDQIAEQEHRHGFGWSYPDHGTATLYGLRCHAYRGDKMKRRAVFWSHFSAWDQCAKLNLALIVLESDAVFVRHFDPYKESDERFGMVSLNDPRGATRKAAEYHTALLNASTRLVAKMPQGQVRFRDQNIVEAPFIDDPQIPQGLPGHSAYLLQPWFAAELVAMAKAKGAMPNDCLACRQWFPGGKLGCLTSYATRTSGRPSTLL